jgi:hypothetical protein
MERHLTLVAVLVALGQERFQGRAVDQVQGYLEGPHGGQLGGVEQGLRTRIAVLRAVTGLVY